MHRGSWRGHGGALHSSMLGASSQDRVVSTTITRQYCVDNEPLPARLLGMHDLNTT